MDVVWFPHNGVKAVDSPEILAFENGSFRARFSRGVGAPRLYKTPVKLYIRV